MDKDVRRRKADELREYVSTLGETHWDERKKVKIWLEHKSWNLNQRFTSSAVYFLFIFYPYFRPNKDDGKKNEERTGVKKKGEYYIGEFSGLKIQTN